MDRETFLEKYYFRWLILKGVYGNIQVCPGCDDSTCRDHELSEELRFVRVPLLTNQACAIGTADDCPNGYIPEQITENMV